MRCGKQAPPGKTALLIHRSDRASLPRIRVAMYVVTLPKKPTTAPDTFIDRLTEQKKRQLAGLTVTRQPSLATGGGRTAMVRMLESPARRLYELSAYVVHTKLVVVPALFSPNRDLIMRHRKAFQRFVRSYRFLTEHVKVNGR